MAASSGAGVAAAVAWLAGHAGPLGQVVPPEQDFGDLYTFVIVLSVIHALIVAFYVVKIWLQKTA